MLRRKTFSRFLQHLNKNRTKNKDLNHKIQKNFKNRSQVMGTGRVRIISKTIKIKTLSKIRKLPTKFRNGQSVSYTTKLRIIFI
jgi:hypothetical protein